MMRSRSRFLLAVLVAGTIGGMLSGCTPVAHVSARIIDGKPAFSVCPGISPNRISISMTALKPGKSHFKIFWQADGSGRLKPGTVVRYSVPPSGFHSTKQLPAVDFSTQRIDFEVQHIGANGKPLYSVSGLFDGSKLSDTAWVNWNGDRTSNAC